MVVGKPLPLWEGNLSGATFNFGSVYVFFFVFVFCNLWRAEQLEDNVSPTCMYVRSCIFHILLTWETRVDAPRCIWLAKGRLLDGQHATRHKACHWWPIVPACENTAFTFAAIGWKKKSALGWVVVVVVAVLVLRLQWKCRIPILPDVALNMSHSMWPKLSKSRIMQQNQALITNCERKRWLGRIVIQTWMWLILPFFSITSALLGNTPCPISILYSHFCRTDLVIEDSFFKKPHALEGPAAQNPLTVDLPVQN